MNLVVVFLLELFYIQADYFTAAKDASQLTQDMRQVEHNFAEAMNIEGIEQDLATKKKGRTQLIREIERLRGLRDSRVWHIL